MQPDPNATLQERTEALILEAFSAIRRGQPAHPQTKAFYRKIESLLSADLQQQLQNQPTDAVTAEKLHLEMSLHFQRQVFALHAALFLDAYDNESPK